MVPYVLTVRESCDLQTIWRYIAFPAYKRYGFAWTSQRVYSLHRKLLMDRFLRLTRGFTLVTLLAGSERNRFFIDNPMRRFTRSTTLTLQARTWQSIVSCSIQHLHQNSYGFVLTFGFAI
jgi:hypothetical protein